MQVTVNGERLEIVDGTSVRQLIAALGLHDGPVAVEVDREIVPRARHEHTVLEDGATIEIVQFVGGG